MDLGAASPSLVPPCKGSSSAAADAAATLARYALAEEIDDFLGKLPGNREAAPPPANVNSKLLFSPKELARKAQPVVGYTVGPTEYSKRCLEARNAARDHTKRYGNEFTDADPEGLVGQPVRDRFQDEGVFDGYVLGYNAEKNLYLVETSDVQAGLLTAQQVQDILMFTPEGRVYIKRPTYLDERWDTDGAPWAKSILDAMKQLPSVGKPILDPDVDGARFAGIGIPVSPVQSVEGNEDNVLVVYNGGNLSVLPKSKVEECESMPLRACL